MSSELPAELDPLTDATKKVWRQIRDAVPASAYLAGGTALAVHLKHRQSDDLDFFLEESVDLDRLAINLGMHARVEIDLQTNDTLNCFVDGVYLQFLGQGDATRLEETTLVDGIRLAGLSDILAMKVLAVAQRTPPDIKDYVDLWAMETAANRRLEEGIALVAKRYPRAAQEGVPGLALRALAYFDDLQSSPMPRFLARPISLRSLEKYWTKRIPEVVRNLGIDSV